MARTAFSVLAEKFVGVPPVWTGRRRDLTTPHTHRWNASFGHKSPSNNIVSGWYTIGLAAKENEKKSKTKDWQEESPYPYSPPPWTGTAYPRTPLHPASTHSNRSSSHCGWRRRRGPGGGGGEEAEPGADDERRPRDVHEEAPGLDDALQSLRFLVVGFFRFLYLVWAVF